MAVDPRPVEPAFGFVFRAAGRTLAVSGDTRASTALIEAARGCDLLVHEAFVHDALPMVPGVREAATIGAAATYRTALAEVGAIASAARARALLLAHLVPPGVDPAPLVAEAARRVPGPVIAGEDLRILDLADGRVIRGGLHARRGGWAAG